MFLPSFQSFVPEFIQLLSGKNTAELAVIAENLRVFRILRSLKMVSYLLVFCRWVNNLLKVIPLNLKRDVQSGFFRTLCKTLKKYNERWGHCMLNLMFYGGEKKGRACHDVSLSFISTPETLKA